MRKGYSQGNGGWTERKRRNRSTLPIRVLRNRGFQGCYLLETAAAMKSSVQGEDERDVESLCESLKMAMAADDPAAVAGLKEELDDIPF
jgi:hypothetical protein